MGKRLIFAVAAAFFLALVSGGCLARELILNGLFPGEEGFSAPRWAVADLSSNLAAPVQIGSYLGTIPSSQLRKNGRTCLVGGVGLMASSINGQSHINFTDISTGQVISSVNLLLRSGFDIAYLFTEPNATVLYALASSANRSESFFTPFVIDKLRSPNPSVIALPSLSFPSDLRDPTAPMVATKTPDDILIMVGGSLLYWKMSDLTAQGKLVWTLNLPNGLGVDAMAAVTTDTKVTNAKVAVVWDHFFSSTIYLLDMANQAVVPYDLRKFCGGDTSFSVRARHAFFDFFTQQFYVVADSCGTATISLISLDVSVYPPSASVKPQLNAPLDKSVFDFDTLFSR